jgi:hypothetical protein
MSVCLSPAMIAARASPIVWRSIIRAGSKLALLDIIPTSLMWERMDASARHAGLSLDLPGPARPMPENLIGRARPNGWNIRWPAGPPARI